MTHATEVLMSDFYSQEEVHQILELAIARQVQSGDLEQLTRAQLLEIAEEMGISSTELQVAEQEWQIRQGEAREQSEFNLYRRGRFKRRFTRYVIVNGFLGAIAFFATGGWGWTLYIALGWGMFVSLDAWNSYQVRGDRYEEAFQKWRRRRLFRRSVNNFLNRWLKA